MQQNAKRAQRRLLFSNQLLFRLRWIPRLRITRRRFTYNRKSEHRSWIRVPLRMTMIVTMSFLGVDVLIFSISNFVCETISTQKCIEHVILSFCADRKSLYPCDCLGNYYCLVLGQKNLGLPDKCFMAKLST